MNFVVLHARMRLVAGIQSIGYGLGCGRNTEGEKNLN
jgi:hypothetical protein